MAGATKRNIAARRKLADLYVKGTLIRFDAEGVTRVEDDADPPTEDQVDLWVQPPSPLQREMAMREAQAYRARALLNAKRNPESDENLSAQAFLIDMSDETLIDYVLIGEQEDRQREAMRDVLAKDEWDDFTAFQDSMRQFEESGAAEDDPEWVGLIERDNQFGDQVNDRFVELTTAAREALAMVPREKIEKRAIDRRIDLIGSQAFMKAYERWMLYYSARDPKDHRELFFESVDEISDMPEFVYTELAALLAEFISDGGQAKNSLRAAPSSDSSVPPAEPETSVPSTPEEQSE